MNLKYHLEAEEYKYLVWQLANMSSSNLTDRRAAEMYLQKQVIEGNDLVMLLAVLHSPETVGSHWLSEIKMAAVLYFKTTIGTTLKLTEIDIGTMKEIEQLMLQCIVLSDLTDIMVNQLAGILSLLYASRHCSFGSPGAKEIEYCVRSCNTLLCSFQEKEVKAGVVMAEAIISSFVGGEFEKIGNPLANILLNRLLIFWQVIQGSINSGAATVEAFQQYFDFRRIELFTRLLRALYRLIAKAAKQPSPHLVLTQLLLNEKLCVQLLPQIMGIVKHVTIDNSSFNNPPLLLTLLSESLFILNKLYEGFKSMKISLKSTSDIVNNYKGLVQLGENLATCFLEKCTSLILVGDECFKDKVHNFD